MKGPPAQGAVDHIWSPWSPGYAAAGTLPVAVAAAVTAIAVVSLRSTEVGESMSSAQDYIDDMARERGYVLDYHKVMAAADFAVLQAANGLVNAAYLAQRTLDRRTKELLFVVSLTVLRAPLPQIRSHIRVALDHGASPQEILEAIEIALPQAGVVAFQWGVQAWQDVVGVEVLEPTVPVHTGDTEDASR